MIGRERPYKPYELDRWVRGLVASHGVTSTELLVAFYLASRAKDEKEGRWYRAVSWPSVATIAQECGYKVNTVKRKSGRVDRTNSTIAAALRGLERKNVLWSEQSGRQGAVRELLFNPEAQHTDQPVGEGKPAGSQHTDGPDFAHRPVGGEELPVNRPGKEQAKLQNKPESSTPTDRCADTPTHRSASKSTELRRLDPMAALTPPRYSQRCRCERPVLHDGTCAKCGHERREPWELAA